MSIPAGENKRKTTSSVHDAQADKPAFGSRFLTDEQEVWSQNAWDHVPPPDDQGEIIAKALEKQKSNPVPVEEKVKYNEKPAKHWDNFYKANADNFFKNRKWLHNEFPDLVAATKEGAGPFVVAEIGCGAGNSAFPLLAANENPELRIHAYDYSSHAVKVVQNAPLYLEPPIGSIQASVWDLTSKQGIPADLQPGTVDIVVLVFVLSALHPDEWVQAVDNIHTMLKPGGLVVLRDYGRYDLTQLRFKGGRMLDDNFYIRGDKTRVYFFELDEIALMFTGSKATASQHEHASTTSYTVEGEEEGKDEQDSASNPSAVSEVEGLLGQLHVSDSVTSLSEPPPAESGLAISERTDDTPQNGTAARPPPVIHPNLLSPASLDRHPLFTATQLGVDRRLLVNRKRQLKMYRVWMQGQFRKAIQ
ncbi:actin filament binding protein [Coprinopsis sp. MPI-PUGE-AT-0042]|nr:actin filament binding protein [Coprinopsis sp. MPI-PUGE-AT-0042]